MKGDPAIVHALNEALKGQMMAINQFFLHARMLRNWGLEKLNDQEYKRSIKAMKQADDLMERVLFLESLPNLQDLGKLFIGEDPQEILADDLKLENDIHSGLVDSITQCESKQDFVSRDLLEQLLEENEEHIDWLEAQLWLIDNSGIENYLQSGI